MRNFSVHLVFLLSAVVGFQSFSDKPVNPGFRVILTTKGLEYAHEVGLNVLKEWLCGYTIPTLNVTSQVGLANITYNFSNVNIYSLDFGDSSLTSDGRGFVLTVKDFAISFSTDFLLHEYDWPYFTDRGSGNFSVRGLSLAISVDLLVNRTGSQNGHFAINVTSCSLSVDKVYLQFSGGASYIYNLFGPALSGFVRRELHRKGCRQLIKLINKYAHKYINHLKTTMKVRDDVEIDYGLVSDANFSTKGRVVTDHKGDFLLVANPTDPPFHAPSLPDPSEDKFPESKMIHIVVSKYVAETAAYAFKESGQLAYNITSKKTLCTKYPKMDVTLGIAVSSNPTFNITVNHTALEADILVTMYVADGGREDIAFALEFHAQADVVPFFREDNNHICGNVSNARVMDMSLRNSTIGEFDFTELENVIKNALLPLGVIYVNTRYTQPGFPIPARDGITFTNSTIAEGEGYIVVSGDISFEPTFLKSNMTCLYHVF